MKDFFKEKTYNWSSLQLQCSIWWQKNQHSTKESFWTSKQYSQSKGNPNGNKGGWESRGRRAKQQQWQHDQVKKARGKGSVVVRLFAIGNTWFLLQLIDQDKDSSSFLYFISYFVDNIPKTKLQYPKFYLATAFKGRLPFPP